MGRPTASCSTVRLAACSCLHCDKETGRNCVTALRVHALFTKLYTDDQINMVIRAETRHAWRTEIHTGFLLVLKE
jgi:hypothetical protein